MLTLKLLTAEQVSLVFSELDSLLPLHRNLIQKIKDIRRSDGRIDDIGRVFLEWLPTLTPYYQYCANIHTAKETLDSIVKQHKGVSDYLRRCRESPFSRKMDLFMYVDLPRQRLMKYPLLLKRVMEATLSENLTDYNNLKAAIDQLSRIVAEIDQLEAQSRYNELMDKIEFQCDIQKKTLEDCTQLNWKGDLKATKGTKLTAFLFDGVLLLTRNTTRNDNKPYQVYRQPIILKEARLILEEGKKEGSFRNSLRNNEKTIKHSFKIRSTVENRTYTLICATQDDKKLWVRYLQQGITTEQTLPAAKKSGVRRCSSQATPNEESRKKEKAPMLKQRARSQTVTTLSPGKQNVTNVSASMTSSSFASTSGCSSNSSSFNSNNGSSVGRRDSYSDASLQHSFSGSVTSSSCDETMEKTKLKIELDCVEDSCDDRIRKEVVEKLVDEMVQKISFDEQKIQLV